jgi:hypothetical protein
MKGCDGGEYDNKPLYSINGRESPDYMSNYQLLKELFYGVSLYSVFPKQSTAIQVFRKLFLIMKLKSSSLSLTQSYSVCVLTTCLPKTYFNNIIQFMTHKTIILPVVVLYGGEIQFLALRNE